MVSTHFHQWSHSCDPSLVYAVRLLYTYKQASLAQAPPLASQLPQVSSALEMDDSSKDTDQSAADAVTTEEPKRFFRQVWQSSHKGCSRLIQC